MTAGSAGASESTPAVPGATWHHDQGGKEMLPSVLSDLQRLEQGKEAYYDLIQALDVLGIKSNSPKIQLIGDALSDAETALHYLSGKLDQAWMNETMTTEQWNAFREAEQRLYQYTGSPVIGWTDVNTLDDSQPMKWLWDQCETYIEANDPHWDSLSTASQHKVVARRLARINAVMVYGPEYLLI